MNKLNMLRNIILAAVLLVGSTSVSFAKIASEDDIKLLKQDLLEGRIKIGETRLKKIKDAYGDAPSITSTETKLTYDYGDLKIEFDKVKYFRDWEYDYSHRTLYTDDIDNLRFDLEDGQLVGDFITFSDIRKDYGEPTEKFETDDDGQWSIYYYGEVKMKFKNNIVVRSWRGKGLSLVGNGGGVLSSSKE